MNYERMVAAVPRSQVSTAEEREREVWERIDRWRRRPRVQPVRPAPPAIPAIPIHVSVASITVCLDGAADEWSYELAVLAHHRLYRLTFSDPNGDSWGADASDVFECLRLVRAQIEPRGYRVCCNGARRNAFVSGMVRDMGAGYSVYLAQPGAAIDERPPLACTLDPAPNTEVVTNEEQDEWVEAWCRRAAIISRERKATQQPLHRE